MGSGLSSGRGQLTNEVQTCTITEFAPDAYRRAAIRADNLTRSDGGIALFASSNPIVCPISIKEHSFFFPCIRAGAIYADNSTIKIDGITSLISNEAFFDGGEVCDWCVYPGMLQA